MTESDQIGAALGKLIRRGRVTEADVYATVRDVVAGFGGTSRRRARRASWLAGAVLLRTQPDRKVWCAS